VLYFDSIIWEKS